MTNRTATGHRRYLDEGYAVGTTDEGVWLTVWGSAYDGALVYGEQSDAEERAELLRSRCADGYEPQILVRRVRRVGNYYRITPTVDPTS